MTRFNFQGSGVPNLCYWFCVTHALVKVIIFFYFLIFFKSCHPDSLKKFFLLFIAGSLKYIKEFRCTSHISVKFWVSKVRINDNEWESCMGGPHAFSLITHRLINESISIKYLNFFYFYF